jgi:phospholipid/cholesterol/gamma-HCH transport system substrate-binding protein
MNNTQQTVRVGFFFILGLALTWVAFETLSDGTVFQDRGYTIVAGFPDLKSLKPGDEVRMAGVRVGAVESTRLEGRRAEAVLRINPEAPPIPGDATAAITMAGLLGTNFISIDFGSIGAAPLPPGAEIRTRVTPDLNSVMSDLGNVGQRLEEALGSLSEFAQGRDGQPSLFQRIDTLVAQNSENLTQSIAHLEDVSGKISRGEGTIGRLVNDPALHDELLAAVADIRAGAEDARRFMASFQEIASEVHSGRGTLGALVYDPAAAENLRTTLANLREVSDKLASGEGTLGQLINDDSLIRDARGTLQKAERALEGMEDAGPINAAGVVARSLF